MAKKNRDIEVYVAGTSPVGTPESNVIYVIAGKYKGELVYKQTHCADNGKGRINSAAVYITQVRNQIRKQYAGK